MSSLVTGASVLRDVAVRPGHVAVGHVAHAVQDVGAEDHQVQRAGAVIALAVAAQHLNVSDLPGVDDLLEPLLVGGGAPVGHHDAHAVPVAGLHHGVGVGQRGGERLLAENALDARLRRRHHHVAALVGPARAHRHHVEPFAGQHVAVVEVVVVGPEPARCLGAARLVRVCDRNHRSAVQGGKGISESMAVVAAAGGADDPGAQGGIAHLAAQGSR